MLDNELQGERDDRSERFISLLKRHERRLNGYILSLVHHWADADDILQEVAIALWRQFNRFDPATDFGTWACTVAHYHVLSYRKSTKRQRLRFTDKVDCLLDEEIATVAREFGDHRDMLRRCVDKLSESDRGFLHAYYSGIPIAELSQRLARSAASLYKDLSGLRRTLRTCVDRALGQEERRL